MAGGAKRRIHHRGHGSLAVGAGDDDRREGVLGIAERCAELRDVRKAELHAEALETEKEADVGTARPERRRAAHGTGAGRAGTVAGAAARTARAGPSADSARGETRATAPLCTPPSPH